MDKKTILIADDEQSVRLLVKKILGQDYLVLEASDGEVAVDIARTRKPALILMDIMMPKVDGYTACHVIKMDEQTKVIPVVMLTALSHDLNKKLSTQLGADGYITKPFSSSILRNTIGRFLSNKKAK